MTVRIKTIPNNNERTGKTRANIPPAHQANRSSGESGPTNKILELEWEALGRKLKKHTDRASGSEIDKLHKQLKEKDEKLKQAELRIAELKKQLFALQEKQRMHKQQPVKGGHTRPNAPVKVNKNDIQINKKAKPHFSGHHYSQGPAKK